MDTESKVPLAAVLRAARGQLVRMAEELEALRYRSLGVLASLPPAAMEVDPLLEDETMDERTQMRAAIQHALEAFIEPCIATMRKAASGEEA